MAVVETAVAKAVEVKEVATVAADWVVARAVEATAAATAAVD